MTRLAGILLTHWHHDHVGGVADVRALLADVMATAAEKNASSEKNGSDVVPAYKRVRRDKGERSIPLSAPAEAHRAPRTYVDLEDGQILDAVPGATLRVSLTPGHAEDHACFELVEEGSVFAGDCVVNGTPANFEDLAAYSASLERMAKELEASKANAEAKCAEAKRRARRSSEDDDARDDDAAAAVAATASGRRRVGGACVRAAVSFARGRHRGRVEEARGVPRAQVPSRGEFRGGAQGGADAGARARRADVLGAVPQDVRRVGAVAGAPPRVRAHHAAAPGEAGGGGASRGGTRGGARAVLARGEVHAQRGGDEEDEAQEGDDEGETRVKKMMTVSRRAQDRRK